MQKLYESRLDRIVGFSHSQMLIVHIQRQEISTTKAVSQKCKYNSVAPTFLQMSQRSKTKYNISAT